MTAIISLSDLNTSVNHEPRVLDVLLAERLGFADKYKVRELIERNRAELEFQGVVSATVAETSSKGGRPAAEYWLNEWHAILVCMFSRTEKAAEVRKAVIEVYKAYRQQKTVAEPQPRVAVRAYTRRPRGSRLLHEHLRKNGMGVVRINGALLLVDFNQNCFPDGGEALVFDEDPYSRGSSLAVKALAAIPHGVNIRRGLGYTEVKSPDRWDMHPPKKVNSLARVVSRMPEERQPQQCLPLKQPEAVVK
jgi:hypothetical protein